MTATVAQSSITFSDFPLEAHIHKAQEGKLEAVVFQDEVTFSSTSSHTSAVDAFFGTRRKTIAVIIDSERTPGPICVGRQEELIAKMAEFEDQCEENATALTIWLALKHCRNFVTDRNHAEALVAGGVAA